MSHSKKLFQIASVLDKYANYETSELDALIEAAENVGKSWSGSWLSFESTIYNRDFQPTDEIYKRGSKPQYGAYGVLLSADWQTYSSNRVKQYVNEKAGNPSTGRFSDDGKEATKAFKRAKSFALSFVYENFNTESDRFIQSWVGEIEELEIFTEDDFIEAQRSSEQKASKNRDARRNNSSINMFRRRRNTLGSRVGTVHKDSPKAVEENTETPPHIAVLAKILATKQPFEACKVLNEQIVKLAIHMTSIDETLLETGESGHQTDRADNISSLEGNPDRIEPLDQSPDTTPRTMGSDVFIVHGHDEAAKHVAARFVERLGLDAIILDEQVSRGQTIIEKLEQKASNADFAIVLLTPDDMGAPKDKLDELKPRARQNVVLELGYFLRGLGRERVCVLHKEKVELPSDIHGIIYVPMDDYDGWQNKLRQEIEHAGLPVQNR